MDAQSERAAIVEYIKWCAERHEKLAATKGYKMRGKYHAEACQYLAHYIEQGEHHAPAPPIEEA